jgi:hypothetical protein
MTRRDMRIDADANSEVLATISGVQRCLADVLFALTDASSEGPANDRLSNFFVGASNIAEALKLLAQLKERRGARGRRCVMSKRKLVRASMHVGDAEAAVRFLNQATNEIVAVATDADSRGAAALEALRLVRIVRCLLESAVYAAEHPTPDYNAPVPRASEAQS